MWRRLHTFAEETKCRQRPAQLFKPTWLESTFKELAPTADKVETRWWLSLSTSLNWRFLLYWSNLTSRRWFKGQNWSNADILTSNPLIVINQVNKTLIKLASCKYLALLWSIWIPSSGQLTGKERVAWLKQHNLYSAVIKLLHEKFLVVI